ncbi:unnamed protein product, partial [marine sediment metagenome]
MVKPRPGAGKGVLVVCVAPDGWLSVTGGEFGRLGRR